MRRASHRPLALFWATACLLGAGGAAASEFVPWRPGDFATFLVRPSGDTRRIEIDRTRRLWNHYSDFAGFGPLWVRVHPLHERVLVRSPEANRLSLFADFDAPVGTRFRVHLGPCDWPAAYDAGRAPGAPMRVCSVILAARGETIATPAGVFENVIRLEFETSLPFVTDGTPLAAWFAPGVGFVRFDVVPFVDPSHGRPFTIATHQMVSGRIGGRIFPRPQGLEVGAFFPGPVLTQFGTPPPRIGTDPAPPGTFLPSPILDPLPGGIYVPTPTTRPCGLDECWPLPPPKVPVRLTARNQSAHDLEWETPTSQSFEITIFDADGAPVSRWSRGKTFTQAFERRVLPAGAHLTAEGQIELVDDDGRLLEPGPYTIEMEVLGIGVSASAPLDIVPGVVLLPFRPVAISFPPFTP